MKIVIVGDICPSKQNYDKFSAGNSQVLFGDLMSLFDRADLTIFNLESPITEADEQAEKIGPCFKAPIQTAKTIFDAGLMVAGLANNHIRDYGDKGVRDTLDYCHKAGLQTVGAGQNITEAKKALYIHSGTMKVGIIGLSDQEFSCATKTQAGANPFDPLESIDDLRVCKKDCDLLIVLYHSGIENYQYQTPELQRRCRKMADAGADVVICQHSHCIGTYEQYKDALIVYGQGNCLFESKSKRETWRDGIAVVVDYCEEQSNYSFIPTMIENGTVRLNICDSKTIIDNFENRSKTVADKNKMHELFDELCNSRRSSYISDVLFPNKYMNVAFSRTFSKVKLPFFSRYTSKQIYKLAISDSHKEIIEKLLAERIK